MRVLFTSNSGLGHVHPMVPMALALRERGHQVRWLTGRDATARLRAVGIETDVLETSFEEQRAEYLRRYPEAATLAGPDKPGHAFPRLFGEVVAGQMLPLAVRIARQWRPDLVIHEAAEFSGPIAAALIDVPAATYAFGALTPIERVEGASERVEPLWRSVGLEPRSFGGLYDGLYLDIYPPSLQAADMSHVPYRQPVRTMEFDDPGDGTSSPGLADWITGEPGADPLVYLTLGTVDRDRSALKTALDGIASRQIRVLATVGETGDLAILGLQPGNVRVERYVPQARVLPHCAVVISHAGSGTFLATLAAGLPQLCLPQAADQFLNTAACERSGAGLALRGPEASSQAIGDALARLLGEPSFGDAARVLSAEIASMPSPDDVVTILEASR